MFVQEGLIKFWKSSLILKRFKNWNCSPNQETRHCSREREKTLHPGDSQSILVFKCNMEVTYRTHENCNQFGQLKCNCSGTSRLGEVHWHFIVYWTITRIYIPTYKTLTWIDSTLIQCVLCLNIYTTKWTPTLTPTPFNQPRGQQHFYITTGPSKSWREESHRYHI